MKYKRSSLFKSSPLTIWKNKNILILFTIGMLFFLCSTHISYRFVEEKVISQQMALLGTVYEKDAKICSEILTYMFENTSSEQKVNLGKNALLEFGYTQKGLEYLYQQKGFSELHFYVLMIQGAIFILLWIVLWYFQKQQYEQEELLISDIQQKKQKQYSSTMINKNTYPSCNPMLVNELQVLLQDLCAYKKETEEVKVMAQNFVENVAHQIKTPLACVSISLDLLFENLKEKEQKERIEEAFRYLKNIELLMKRLLYIGRLESGKLLLKKEPVFLEEVLNECKYLLDPQEKRILLEVKCEVLKEQGFYGDYEWLKEAFLNILKNCMEHDIAEHPIFVRLVFQEEMIFIKIRDYGTGITKQDIAHIFDRFYIPEHAKSNHTGIGLNLAKLIVEKHFGMIEVINHENGGAEFSIVFPLYELKNEKM